MDQVAVMMVQFCYNAYASLLEGEYDVEMQWQ